MPSSVSTLTRKRFEIFRAGDQTPRRSIYLLGVLQVSIVRLVEWWEFWLCRTWFGRGSTLRLLGAQRVVQNFPKFLDILELLSHRDR